MLLSSYDKTCGRMGVAVTWWEWDSSLEVSKRCKKYEGMF
jgi:hypothetical protein